MKESDTNDKAFTDTSLDLLVDEIDYYSQYLSICIFLVMLFASIFTQIKYRHQRLDGI